MNKDCMLDTLLEGGYWMKFEAWWVEVTEAIPHGIRDSLTLHDKSGRRLMGYDNSHAVSLPKKFKYAGQRLPYDHRHRHAVDKGVPYEFTDAGRLLEDFFAEANDMLRGLKV